MKCVIIDDEPLAAELIKGYCQQLDFLEIAGIFHNPLDAINLLSNEKIDILFLDIEMPQINGVEFISAIQNPPKVIFTTAYSGYAVEGFELNAVDYLLKPISYGRFIKAVSRLMDKNEVDDKQLPESNNIFPSEGTEFNEDNFIFIKSDYENVKVFFNDIKYVQGLKDYLKIYSSSSPKPLLTLMSFKTLEEKLPAQCFERVHKSYLVNISHIDSVQRNRIVIDDTRIPIGESYKNQFLARLGL